MRPVDRGAAPAVYARYQDAGPALRERLGDYCSYCERQIETHLAVEHIQPKLHEPALLTSWANFLLGCVNCNSTKGDKHIVLADHFWPDADNTLRAFKYAHGGRVLPHPMLSLKDRIRARATIQLVGLDCDPGNPLSKPSSADLRWLRRQQIWQVAERYRDYLMKQDTEIVRVMITENAMARGCFSIWWTVFADDAEMRRRFREAFIGTHKASFDAHENLLPRTGGQL